MRLSEVQISAFASVMEKFRFEHIAPNVWRRNLVTANISENPGHIVIRHKSGFKILDQKIFNPACFNAVLASVEKARGIEPTPNMIYLVLAGVSQPAYYMERAGDDYFMARDTHIHGPAETFGDVAAVYKVKTPLSVMGVSLNGRNVRVTASAKGKVSLQFLIGEKFVSASVNPNTAAHVMAGELLGRTDTQRKGADLFATLAYLAPSGQYTWRTMQGKATPKIRGRAKLALKKGSVIGLRQVKKGDDIKYFVVELKEKGMIEYTIPARVYDDLTKASKKRAGKAPAFGAGAEKKSYKKDAGTPDAQRNKNSSKPAVVAPKKALRKVAKAPAPVNTAALEKKYATLFGDKSWTLAKLLKTIPAEFGATKPKTKALALKYLATKLKPDAYDRIAAQLAAKKLKGLSLEDRAIVARVTSQYDDRTVLHALKGVLKTYLPDPMSPTFTQEAVLTVIRKKLMTEEKMMEAIAAQAAKMERLDKALKNPPKKAAIGAPPTITGSKSLTGSKVTNVAIQSDPSQLPDDYRSPEQITEGDKRSLKQNLLDKMKNSTVSIYQPSEKDTDVTAALKAFILDLTAKGGSVLSRGGQFSKEHDNAWINGKAKSEDFMVQTHPTVLYTDADGNDVVSQQSTEYFLNWFQNKYAKNAAITIKSVKHSNERAFNDVVDITFSTKKYPNVLLICRLLVNPDEKKSDLISMYNRNMRVADKNNQVALASDKRRASIVNLTIAAVNYNPLGDNFDETYRVLASLVQYG